MKYLLMIYNNAAAREPTEAEFDTLMQGHIALYQELAEAGSVVSSASLINPPAATTVRVQDGVPAVTDGPYLEAKEYLAGYYLVECDSREQAIEIATRIPCGIHGAVEIRAVDEAITRTVRREG
jgi:hypothetical protein